MLSDNVNDIALARVTGANVNDLRKIAEMALTNNHLKIDLIKPKITGSGSRPNSLQTAP